MLGLPPTYVELDRFRAALLHVSVLALHVRRDRLLPSRSGLWCARHRTLLQQSHKGREYPGTAEEQGQRLKQSRNQPSPPSCQLIAMVHLNMNSDLCTLCSGWKSLTRNPSHTSAMDAETQTQGSQITLIYSMTPCSCLACMWGSEIHSGHKRLTCNFDLSTLYCSDRLLAAREDKASFLPSWGQPLLPKDHLITVQSKQQVK